MIPINVHKKVSSRLNSFFKLMLFFYCLWWGSMGLNTDFYPNPYYKDIHNTTHKQTQIRLCGQVADCLAALTPLLCNKGSGVGHQFGHLVFIVTHSNNKEEIKCNVFLVNKFGHTLA